MLNLTVATWIGNAAAVLSGTWGAVTRWAQQSGYSRTAVYTHAQRVVQAVASEQAGGSRYDVLGQENERLKAENAALGQAWAEAEELSEAKQRAFAGSGCAMGLSLSQIVTLLAIVLPRGAVPSRAMIGHWVQAAAAQAGRRLGGLDLACQDRVCVLCLDEIFLHREPVLMAIEPHSMAWMAGQRGPERSGESWCEVLTHWPCLEHVIADGGQGLERGGKAGECSPMHTGRGCRDHLQTGYDDGPGRVSHPLCTRTRHTTAVETRRAAARNGQSGRCQGGTVQATGA